MHIAVSSWHCVIAPVIPQPHSGSASIPGTPLRSSRGREKVSLCPVCSRRALTAASGSVDHVDRSVGLSSRRSTSRSSTQESPAIGYSVVKVQNQHPVFTIVRLHNDVRSEQIRDQDIRNEKTTCVSVPASAANKISRANRSGCFSLPCCVFAGTHRLWGEMAINRLADIEVGELSDNC